MNEKNLVGIRKDRFIKLKKYLLFLFVGYGIAFMIGSLSMSYIIILSIFEKGFIRFIEPNKLMLSIELISIIIAFTSLPFMIHHSFKKIGE